MTQPGLALLALLLLPAATPMPAAPLAEVPVYRTFGRWFVACDNTRTCVARGFADYTRAQLELSRRAGISPATLALSAERKIVAGDVRLDGAPVAFPAPAWSMTDGTLTTRDPAAITAFITAVRDARTLTLDRDRPKDELPLTVPLDGFTAALLLVDAVQGRPGTPTALIAAKGTAAPPTAPPLPPALRWVVPPALTRMERQRLTQQAAQLPSKFFDTCNVSDPSQVYALDAVDAIAIRPCFMAAYQGSSVVAILPRAGGRPRPATGPRPGMPHPEAGRTDMVDPEFDPATGILFSNSKGRGMADCGSSEAWVWSDGGFRLQSLNYLGQCGGTESGDWPPLYRTR